MNINKAAIELLKAATSAESVAKRLQEVGRILRGEKTMKTIKDAVIEFNGIWPEQAKDSKWFVVLTKKLDGSHSEFKVDKEQFESIAKRLDYINGYRWGVEYPTNGKRPDLADDLEVEWSDGDCWRQTKAGSMVWVGGETENPTFRITDPRHKPADEVSEIAESINKAEYVSELRDNKPFDRKVSGFVKAAANKIMGDIMKKELSSMANENKNQESIWFEFGDFPPIGSKVTVTKGGEKLSDFGSEFAGKDCIVRSVFENQHGKNIVSIERPDGACCCFVLEILKPIRTHREKVIEAAVATLKNSGWTHMTNVSFKAIDALLDAGMLVLPQDSSDTKD